MYLDEEIKQTAKKLGVLLATKGKMLITAESCTGGLIGAACTDISGSSSWFYGGIISYDNAAKEGILKVSSATLTSYGAVSVETVEQMCRGALQHGGDVSIAVSGIAGPNGGSPEKPVGTVVIGCMLAGGKPNVRTYLFDGNRDEVRKLTVLNALKNIQILVENEEC